MQRGTIVNPNWTFKDWRINAGYSLIDCATVFDVHMRTVKAWESGKTKPPKAVFLCLQMFSGRLDFLGKKWRGFRILPDCIEADNGQFIYHYEIYALPYLYDQVKIDRVKFLRSVRQNQEAKGNKRPQGFTPFIVK